MCLMCLCVLCPCVCFHLPSTMFSLSTSELTSCSLFSSSFVFAPVHFHKGSRSHFDFCPRPCSRTCRWARLAAHGRRRPHFVRIRALVPTSAVSPPHVCQSPSGRTCRTWVFLRRLHVYAYRVLCLTPLTSENQDPKIWRELPLRHKCHL